VNVSRKEKRERIEVMSNVWGDILFL